MVELETREIEYVVAVAEELHFGRAAERLGIAQPALSKAVQRVERRLGVQLFVRSSRQVVLSPAGEALLRYGRYALDAVSAAVDRTRRAGGAEDRLRLVLKPGGDAGLLSALLAAYAARPDARPVEIVFSGPADRVDLLRAGRADAALLYVPFDDLDGLAHETLCVEPRVAVLSAGHPLASRAELRLADLEHEPMPRWKGVPDGVGDARGSGPEVADIPQLYSLVAVGLVTAVLPRSLVSPAPEGVVCVPVVDAPESRIVVAWSPRDEARPVVASFVSAAAGLARVK
ncbi:LysR family transcriptional regulator [Streptomyces sp. VRA16 Mangrove soil]|uniref:LysR family transcriptional regulator n=1 Tax=Streptomyces sp. VRA16 Mangrove soil TaxID=2817434 RepID=UPI001A9CFBAF|nr:LysR family transcriptional regulator [Streptomyces sp. VRA16 Mangrove soil]MBO1329990.1 LysR family transcriptional regulator [Streptomyces sp. VRA16 Mangrove soil]